MAMLQQVRGVGDRSGIFFAGRPTTLLAMDDGLVLLQASTFAGLLGGQGVAGAAINMAMQRRDAKARDAQSEELTASQFDGQKRSRVISYPDLQSVRLEKTRIGRRVTLDTPSGAAHFRYPPKIWPDDQAAAFFQERVGERFTNAL